MTETASDPMTEAKAALRRDAFARRRAAHAAGAGDLPHATRHLLAAIAEGPAPRRIAGYWPIRTEIDPRPALEALHRAGASLCLPVVEGAGLPLSFRPWTPGAAMIEGEFGAAIPADPAPAVPDLLIVPLVAFDALGARLGYGGGFYDRTLERLRAAAPVRAPVRAIGFAWEAQRNAAPLPVEPTDQPLDLLVTEAGILRF